MFYVLLILRRFSVSLERFIPARQIYQTVSSLADKELYFSAFGNGFVLRLSHPGLILFSVGSMSYQFCFASFFCCLFRDLFNGPFVP